MGFLQIVELLSGIALFLYGVSLMGSGLNRSAGNKLEVVVYKLSSTPLKGALLGAVVTALIQSSAAASAMVVGFVNSSMMEFGRAIYIVLGSILGSSVTGWITSLSMLENAGGWLDLLSSTFITGVFAVTGIYFSRFSKKPNSANIGEILLGFAIIMFGMSTMSSAMSALKDSEQFVSLMTRFSNPLLCLLVGMLFTALIQSSSAGIGVLQVLSMTGVLSFATALPVMLGIAIGGALPVLLTAVGASVNGKRTAVVHLLYDCVGVLIVGVIWYGLNAVHPFAFAQSWLLTPVTVALVNTLFRLVLMVVLFPLAGAIAKLSSVLVKDKAEPEREELHSFDRLEDRFIAHPVLALEQSHSVIEAMAVHVRDIMERAISLLDGYDEEGFRFVESGESLTDRYEDKLGAYLVKINAVRLNGKQNGELYKYLRAITDLERMADHALNIAESAQEMARKNIVFSDPARRELAVMTAAVREVMGLAFAAFTDSDADKALRVEPLEEWIDNLAEQMKSNHTRRLQSGLCEMTQGFVFNDLLTNLERVSDHCSNMALAVIEIETEVFDAHVLKQDHNELFELYYDGYRCRFALSPARE